MPIRNPLKSYREKKSAQEEGRRAQAEYELEQEAMHKKKGTLRYEEREIKGREIALERKQRELELRKKERELKRQQREERYPTGTKVYRRAEQMVGLGASRVEKLPASVATEGASRLRRSAGRVRVTPTTTRIPRDKSGRTRLPVFAESQPGFAERIAMDFGMNKQQDILGSQQQQDIAGQPKVIDFGFGNKQYDLGIGNGNKKKVRYY